MKQKPLISNIQLKLPMLTAGAMSLLLLTACSDGDLQPVTGTPVGISSNTGTTGGSDTTGGSTTEGSSDTTGGSTTEGSSDTTGGSTTEGSSDTTGGSTTEGGSDTTGGSTTGGSGSTSYTGGSLTLEALPSPPLTPAPTQKDEPIQAPTNTSAITQFFVMQDPDVLPDDTSGDITDEEFEAGPLESIVFTPDHVDPTTNSAPYFVNLEDQTIYAGQTMELRLHPVDPDGGVPGLFPTHIPAGANYRDNYDGTRTLIWSPLQPDVGIREFIITAIDPTEKLYRTQQTVRLRVKLPSDLSTIVNLPPAINLVRPHTVRVNDPVVIEIKGTDPNGTIPQLEVLNQPPGSTFVPHYKEPGIMVLRFIPTVAEKLELEVIARDKDDPTSTASKTIEINVREPQDFTRTGESLRNLASARGLKFGFASLHNFHARPDGALYTDTAGKEFNFVSPENSLKWDLINPLPGRYRWASADNVVKLAKNKGFQIHGHTLIWYTQLPSWVKNSEIENRELHMREYIDRILNRYSKDIAIWDVVNEAFEEDGSYRNSVWYEAMGEKFIDIAFRQARLSAPTAQLVYNDFDVAWKGPKADAMFNMLQNLKDNGTPISGVGFQLHVSAKFDQFDEVEENFQRAADMGLDIYVSELDVFIDGDTLEMQAEVYARILDICLKQPRCKGFQAWGFTDMYSWRQDQSPLIMDNEYQAKPAYYSLQQRLSEN